MADSTLSAIRTKVRRITRSPSEAQITTSEIDEYINTYVLYDFPETLKLSALRSTLTFYTEPNIDTYEDGTTPELTNFKNIYSSVFGPVYIGGRESFLSKSREQFYGIYPLNNALLNVGTGDGATTLFTGTLSSTPVLRNNVTFSAVDINGNGLAVYDDGSGTFDGDGAGTINYITGAWAITFATAPESGGEIQAQVIQYEASIPDSVLFYDNKFVMRPIPDRPYKVSVEVYKRPTELLAAGTSPDLEQWWQYIALAAARSIFYDRSDIDSVQQIEPELRRQELLVLRKTISQQSDQRVATIYTGSTKSQWDYWNK